MRTNEERDEVIELLLVTANNPGVGVCCDHCLVCIQTEVGYSDAAFKAACEAMSKGIWSTADYILAAERYERGEV